jgi:DNA-binding transcriptional LysR family regulator
LEIKLDIADVNAFLTVVRTGSVQQAAAVLHQTPSALSKALRRLELALGCPVFDRVGKTLRLNADGERLHWRAVELMRLVDETRAVFRGGEQALRCRVAAPAVLQWRYGPRFAEALEDSFPGASLRFATLFELEAVTAVARDDADFAIVTAEALAQGLPPRLEALPIGNVTMQLAAGGGHPLLAGYAGQGDWAVSTEAVLRHDFACPSHSIFCGVDRGARADGWRDDRLPRRIRYWVDDLQVLIAMVRSGRALAYLPDFSLPEQGLVRLMVSDCPYQCLEQVVLVWSPGQAHGWHRRVAAVFGAVQSPTMAMEKPS